MNANQVSMGSKKNREADYKNLHPTSKRRTDKKQIKRNTI